MVFIEDKEWVDFPEDSSNRMKIMYGYYLFCVGKEEKGAELMKLFEPAASSELPFHQKLMNVFGDIIADEKVFSSLKSVNFEDSMKKLKTMIEHSFFKTSRVIVRCLDLLISSMIENIAQRTNLDGVFSNSKLVWKVIKEYELYSLLKERFIDLIRISSFFLSHTQLSNIFKEKIKFERLEKSEKKQFSFFRRKKRPLKKEEKDYIEDIFERLSSILTLIDTHFTQFRFYFSTHELTNQAEVWEGGGGDNGSDNFWLSAPQNNNNDEKKERRQYFFDTLNHYLLFQEKPRKEKTIILKVIPDTKIKFMILAEVRGYAITTSIVSSHKFMIWWNGESFALTRDQIGRYLGNDYFFCGRICSHRGEIIRLSPSDVCDLNVLSQHTNNDGVLVIRSPFLIKSGKEKDVLLSWGSKSMKEKSQYEEMVGNYEISNPNYQKKVIRYLFSTDEIGLMDDFALYAELVNRDILYYDPITFPGASFSLFPNKYQKFLILIHCLNSHSFCEFNKIPRDVLIHRIIPFVNPEDIIFEGKMSYVKTYVRITDLRFKRDVKVEKKHFDSLLDVDLETPWQILEALVVHSKSIRVGHLREDFGRIGIIDKVKTRIFDLGETLSPLFHSILSKCEGKENSLVDKLLVKETMSFLKEIFEIVKAHRSSFDKNDLGSSYFLSMESLYPTFISFSTKKKIIPLEEMEGEFDDTSIVDEDEETIKTNYLHIKWVLKILTSFPYKERTCTRKFVDTFVRVFGFLDERMWLYLVSEEEVLLHEITGLLLHILKNDYTKTTLQEWMMYEQEGSVESLSSEKERLRSIIFVLNDLFLQSFSRRKESSESNFFNVNKIFPRIQLSISNLLRIGVDNIGFSNPFADLVFEICLEKQNHEILFPYSAPQFSSLSSSFELVVLSVPLRFQKCSFYVRTLFRAIDIVTAGLSMNLMNRKNIRKHILESIVPSIHQIMILFSGSNLICSQIPSVINTQDRIGIGFPTSYQSGLFLEKQEFGSTSAYSSLYFSNNDIFELVYILASSGLMKKLLLFLDVENILLIEKEIIENIPKDILLKGISKLVDLLFLCILFPNSRFHNNKSFKMISYIHDLVNSSLKRFMWFVLNYSKLCFFDGLENMAYMTSIFCRVERNLKQLMNLLTNTFRFHCGDNRVVKMFVTVRKILYGCEHWFDNSRKTNALIQLAPSTDYFVEDFHDICTLEFTKQHHLLDKACLKIQKYMDDQKLNKKKKHHQISLEEKSDIRQIHFLTFRSLFFFHLVRRRLCGYDVPSVVLFFNQEILQYRFSENLTSIISVIYTINPKRGFLKDLGNIICEFLTDQKYKGFLSLIRFGEKTLRDPKFSSILFLPDKLLFAILTAVSNSDSSILFFNKRNFSLLLEKEHKKEKYLDCVLLFFQNMEKIFEVQLIILRQIREWIRVSEYLFWSKYSKDDFFFKTLFQTGDFIKSLSSEANDELCSLLLEFLERLKELTNAYDIYIYTKAVLFILSSLKNEVMSEFLNREDVIQTLVFLANISFPKQSNDEEFSLVEPKESFSWSPELSQSEKIKNITTTKVVEVIRFETDTLNIRKFALEALSISIKSFSFDKLEEKFLEKIFSQIEYKKTLINEYKNFIFTIIEVFERNGLLEQKLLKMRCFLNLFLINFEDDENLKQMVCDELESKGVSNAEEKIMNIYGSSLLHHEKISDQFSFDETESTNFDISFSNFGQQGGDFSQQQQQQTTTSFDMSGLFSFDDPEEEQQRNNTDETFEFVSGGFSFSTSEDLEETNDDDDENGKEEKKEENIEESNPKSDGLLSWNIDKKDDEEKKDGKDDVFFF